MDREQLLAALQRELLRHDFDHFIDNPPSIAQGGKGVVVPGCSVCKKSLQTMNQFMEHLAVDALPAAIRKAMNS